MSSNAGSLDDLLISVDLSKTSTTKFDPLRHRIAEWLDFDPESVYASTVGKDFKVRFEQSAHAREAPVGLAILTDPDFLEPSLSPARAMVSSGTKESVIFVAHEEPEPWRVVQVVERVGSGISTRLSMHAQGFQVDKVPGELEAVADENRLFTKESFDLLKQLKEDPTAAFYTSHRAEFRRLVEEPFHSFLQAVVSKLPESITRRMETRDRIFSRFVKNDYGRGGAWPHYWGAIFVGESRIRGVQLFAWMDEGGMRIGFTAGEYAGDFRSRFVGNCHRYADELVGLLSDVVADERFVFGYPENVPAESWSVWLARPEDSGAEAILPVSRHDVLTRSPLELIQLATYVFRSMFPLVLLATEDDPMPAIAAYLGEPGPPPIVNPVYPLPEIAAKLAVDVQLLERWVRAIERHGQAILYGPPGTGKTYVAEHLADHLIGEGDGFKDVVQFHPAYSYEDFIQGLRPQARKDGGLEYPQVPGRFMEFCAEAARRKGRCVLIVDEINRANLSRVFGELMYLLEYRDRSATGGPEVRIPLASGERFGIPANVRIIGSMNSDDSSFALVDHALRRRFAFLALYPNYEVLRHHLTGQAFPTDELIKVLHEVNAAIADPHYEVGVTFFLRPELANDIRDIWELQIEPYLDEYFFDRLATLDNFRWSKLGPRLTG